ncbi:hypothetical protein DSM112329_03744 [Paraconexibacter sp. AEG42_29]|uniref:DM13 domain-containing protein n=1 Tax=Paraconexibacter sp. AEG42_29 TaxID=2997339 RepID=A0AAU7AYN7_9ACTN
MLRRTLVLTLMLCAAALAVLSSPAAARNVELLRGTVRPLSHSASGTAAVVSTGSGRRVLTLRSFRLDPGPRVRVWLVPRSAQGDGQLPKDRVDLGKLKGTRGNQQYTIPKSVDLRKYSSVVFWCVPFTSGLARADLRRS